MTRSITFALLLLLGASILTIKTAPTVKGEFKVDPRVFELRTYHAAPGKLDALNARFRDHTRTLFKKHGMTVIGFWTPAEGKEKENTLIYLLAFPDRKAADQSWKAFMDDPEWKKVKQASEKDGKLVDKIDRVFLDPTEYSPLK